MRTVRESQASIWAVRKRLKTLGRRPLHRNHSLLLTAIITAVLIFTRHPAIVGAQQPQSPGAAGQISNPQALPTSNATFALRGTALLTRPVTDDLREEQRQQIIHYFQSQIAATPGKRDALWRPNFSSVDSYKASIEPHRAHLRRMLGFVDPKLGVPQIRTLHEDANLLVEYVTLPAESGLSARVLYFSPRGGTVAGAIIAIPPATRGE